ncbi:MAG: ATP-binding protein [Candidatus Coatesbacteria bacterium]
MNLRAWLAARRAALLGAAVDIERVRDAVFNVLLFVSATAVLTVGFGGQNPFYEPERVPFLRIGVVCWALVHPGLYLLARRGRRREAHVIYVFAAFAVLTGLFQASNTDWFTRLNMQLAQTYSLLFVAVILLPLRWYLIYSTSACAMIIAWSVVMREHFLPPHGTGAASSVIVNVLGMWALTVFGAGLLDLFYERMLSARDGLARLNAKLKDEVTAQAGVITRQQERLFESQKLEAIGLLAGGVAHDFNNKLTVITGYGELLAGRLSGDAPARHWLAGLRSSTEEATRLVRQLLSFSRKEVIRPRAVNVNAFVTERLDVFSRLLGEHIAVVPGLAPDLGNCLLDPGQLEQILVNLLVNARDAMPNGGRIEITTANTSFAGDDPRLPAGLAPGRYVTLSVRDSGTGMDQRTISRLFEPFFTTKEQGKGTGLGLATVYGAIKQNKGDIEVESAPGAGSVFRLHLPRVDLPVSAAPGESAAGAVLRATATILLVEDEPRLRDLMASVLTETGYTVLSAGEPGEAARIEREREGPIHLLITDVRMPNGGARKILDTVADRRPDIRKLFMSGYAEDALADLGVDVGGNFLQKPFTPRALLEKTRQILNAAG